VKKTSPEALNICVNSRYCIQHCSTWVCFSWIWTWTWG